MVTFAEGLEQTSSRKLVFVDMTHPRKMFAWTEDTGLYYADLIDPMRVVSMNENDVAMTETASQAALSALDTSTVGGYWWDFANELLYVKPKSGTTAFENFYVASVLLRMSRDGGELDDEAYDALVSSVPALTMRTNEVFDGKVAEIGAGNIQIANTGDEASEAMAFLQSLGIELDGEAKVIEQLGVYS